MYIGNARQIKNRNYTRNLYKRDVFEEVGKL